MRQLTTLTAVIALLGFAGCGGDDEPSSDAGPTGPTSAHDAQPDTGMTAKQFIDASIPDQVKAVKALVAENPECAKVDPAPGGDFQVGVAINAAQASPDTSLEEIVATQCAGG